MNNKFWITALVTLALTMHAGENGTIIVYRPFSLMGAAAGFPFTLDHGPVMKVRNGCYIRLSVNPGEHVVDHKAGIFRIGDLFVSGDPQRIKIAAGQTVYFLYTAHVFMGNVFEVAEDQAEAKLRVSQLKAQN